MTKRLLILSLLLCTLAALPLRAQWSGTMNLTGGLGGNQGTEDTGIGYLGHALVQGDVSVRYRTKAFSWVTVTKGQWEPKTSDVTRLGYTPDSPAEMETEMIYKTEKKNPLRLSLRSDFTWKPSSSSNYAAWITYEYRYDHGRNVSNTLKSKLSPEHDPLQQVKCSYESPLQNQHLMGTGLRAEWLLGEKSLLQSSCTLSTTSNIKHTTWSLFTTKNTDPDDPHNQNIDEEEAFRRGEATLYRITPRNIDLDFEADIHLRRNVLQGKKKFNWTPGLKIKGNHSSDENSGATLTDIDAQGNYVWKDSLRLRETFNYLELIPQAYIAGEFTGEKIEVSFNYGLQFPFRRLNDDTRQQPLASHGVYPVGNARFTWVISKVHRLSVTHNLEANHPDYLKICWYDRSGGYADQLYRGKEDLLATQRSRYGIVYELKYKSFRFRTNNSVSRRINETDRPWHKETIDGREYKVFEWINSADSWSFGTTNRIGWENKWLTAGIEVEYNQSRRTAKEDGAIKNSSDWSLKGDLDIKIAKGWSIRSNVKYQSGVSTLYSEMKEYWMLDARIQKKFKKVTLFLDGKDLLDSPRESTYTSSNGKESWVDYYRYNRRLILLGIQWNF